MCGSSGVANFLRHIYPPDTLEYREQFYVLYLSRSNEILGYFLHSIGGLSSTTVDIKQILGVALKANAASIILSHCHPSGNTSPSEADRQITKRIVQAASLLDVSVLDHIIVTAEAYHSFADEGRMPRSTANSAPQIAEYSRLYPATWDL